MKIISKKDYKLAWRAYELITKICEIDPSPDNNMEWWYWVGRISEYNATQMAKETRIVSHDYGVRT